MLPTLATATLDLFLPAVCPLCAVTPGASLCRACYDALPVIEAPCPWCGASLGSVTCTNCADRGLPHVSELQVRWSYAGAMQALVSEAKAGASVAAVRACTRLLPVPPVISGPAVVVPVPPSPGRRPGPHLGTALARSMAARMGLHCRRHLRTTRLAAEQHRLGQGERQRNVAGLFAVRGTLPATVVLVDDLLTSGATLSEAARTLKHAGAVRIVAVCLARTAYHGR